MKRFVEVVTGLKFPAAFESESGLIIIFSDLGGTKGAAADHRLRIFLNAGIRVFSPRDLPI